MMKIHSNKIFFFLLLLGFWSCSEDIPQIAPIKVPTNLQVDANVSNDGSGQVSFSASANDAITYHYYLGLGPGETPTLAPDGSLTYAYKQSNDYIVQVVAYGAGGVSSSKTIDVKVEVTFTAPESMIQTLTNGSSRVWKWKQWVPAHLGVGPEFNDDGSVADGPFWYQASPNEKEGVGCLYEDRITFTLNADESVSVALANNGVTYFHVDEAADALGVPKPEFDQCYDLPTQGTKNVGFFQTESGINASTNVGMEINGGFLSYFLNSSTYEILALSGQELHVRTIQDVDGAKLAWYHKFVSAEFDACGDEDRDYEMVWSDEFDIDGTPDPTKWAYDVGTGDNGWGNGEAQTYTDRSDNVFIDNGSLKIKAVAESFQGSPYTSGRIKTEGKFEFTYGKVDVRAKLPSVGGTWPAIWLLGADYQTNPWPATGEIDIMEHVGNNPGVAQAALHSSSSFGDTQNKGSIDLDDPFNEWHVYSVEWAEKNIRFSVDGKNYYSYCPDNRNGNNYPFNHDFFVILNLAMGGSLGGDISSSFTDDTFEIDYVRVYQEK